MTLHRAAPAPVEDAAGDRFTRLRSDAVELILDTSPGGRPCIVYWGQALQHSSPEELALLSVRQWTVGGPAVDVQSSLSNELGTGLSGPAGFVAHRASEDWAAILRIVRVVQPTRHEAQIYCEDANTQLSAVYTLSLDPESHVLSARTRIVNRGEKPLTIDWCASICMPLDRRLIRLLAFTGRWAQEFQAQEVASFRGSYVRENRSGRTSHDNFPGLIAMAKFTSEKAGPAAGFHLGWSGNNRVRVDRHGDGRAFAQMGELFYPGEMELGQGEEYETPPVYAAWSNDGLNALSQRFHRHLVRRVMDGRARRKARPVHFNTWEAIYFDHSPQRLLTLATRAAALGAERFVLDDGWFGGRRDERSGLGDWWVSREVYPNGLDALVEHVRELGMEFGIWFEPEMVNPNSDLYRAHPDWILEANGVEQVPFRDQYTLDLTKPAVFDYLFDCISRVVQEYGVSYVKWDMNRDIHHPGSAGRGAIHRQTRAVYSLIAKLRAAHPSLEIESCSSGGGRADYGVLRYADRLWPSDSNDAGDRQHIQRGASYFFPTSVIGTHVGPRTCHITRRVYSMEYRAGTALFGHMGIELDPEQESEEDLETLSKAVALYKQHRQLIHEGDFARLDSSDYLNVIGVVARDKSAALFSCAKTDGHSTTLPGRFRFAGLDPARRYRMRVVWPTANVSVTSPSIVDAAMLLEQGAVFSGESLLVHGVQLPLMHPDTCLVYHFAAEGD